MEEGISLGSSKMGEVHHSFFWDHVGAVNGLKLEVDLVEGDLAPAGPGYCHLVGM